MARPDNIMSNGRFRAVAHADLDGDAGVWGDTDLLCVQVDGDGLLIAADADNCDGVIWTPEGRRNTHYQSLATSKLLIGGKRYTVFTDIELADMEIGTSPTLAAGDRVFSGAAGDAVVGGSGVYLGVVVDNENIPGGLVLVLRVGRAIGAES